VEAGGGGGKHGKCNNGADSRRPAPDVLSSADRQARAQRAGIVTQEGQLAPGGLGFLEGRAVVGARREPVPQGKGFVVVQGGAVEARDPFRGAHSDVIRVLVGAHR